MCLKFLSWTIIKLWRVSSTSVGWQIKISKYWQGVRRPRPKLTKWLKKIYKRKPFPSQFLYWHIINNTNRVYFALESNFHFLSEECHHQQEHDDPRFSFPNHIAVFVVRTFCDSVIMWTLKPSSIPLILFT